MYNEEEEKLNDYKKIYDNIPISLQSLDDAIIVGFQRAKIEEGRKPRRRKWLISLATAAILLIGFFTTIRLSPAFANYVTVIPGMEKVVELIRFDKGMMSAIENDYYQEIGASKEKNGLEVIIDGAIADENGLILFYTLKSEEKQKELYIDEAYLESLDGEKLILSSASYGTMHSSLEGKKSYSGTLEYFFESPLNARELDLHLEIKGIEIKESFDIAFKIKDEMQGKKTYKLNETVTIEGQKITFLEATVYPLRVAVHVKMDPNNTKKILDFQDLRLVDENGESWNKIANGTTASNISDDEKIIYLQSNYFHKPKELYLVLNKLQAIDKDEAYVLVDIESERILKQPKGNMLSDLKVEGGNLSFTMNTKKEFNYFFFGRILDGSGKEINSESSSHSTDGRGNNEYGIRIPNLQDQIGPISLELTFFPSWIEGQGKVKID